MLASIGSVLTMVFVLYLAQRGADGHWGAAAGVGLLTGLLRGRQRTPLSLLTTLDGHATLTNGLPTLLGQWEMGTLDTLATGSDDSPLLQQLVRNRRVLLVDTDDRLTLALLRLILLHAPAQVLLLGRNEASLQIIQQRVQALSEFDAHALTCLQPVVADLRFEHRLRQIFAQYRPEIVLHSTPRTTTAISRQNVAEVVSHTILATHTLLHVANDWQITKLVLISSIDVVQPATVVAVSNRITEQIVIRAAHTQPAAYSVVRLGNLLLDQPVPPDQVEQQLAKAGARHTTSSSHRYYCMTVDEAARRVLQAAQQSKGGEIFVPHFAPPVQVRFADTEAAGSSTIASLAVGELQQRDLFDEQEIAHALRAEHFTVVQPDPATAPCPTEMQIATLATAVRQNDTATVLYTLRTILPRFNPHAQPRATSGVRRWHPSSLPASERRFMLVVGSILMLVVSGGLTWWLTRLLSVQPINPANFWWLLVVALSWLVLAFINDCFSLTHIARPYRALRNVLTTTLETGILYLLLFFVFSFPIFNFNVPNLTNRADPPRLITSIYVLTIGALASGWWLAYGAVFEQTARRRRAIVVGAGQSGRSLVQALHQVAHDYEVVGFIDDNPALQHRLIEEVPVLGTRYDLLDRLRETGAQEIILAITHDLHADLLQVLMSCYEQGIPVKPMLMIHEEVMGRIPVEHLGQNWFPTPFWNTPRMGGLQILIKRLIDIGVSLAGLIALGLIFPFIALAIRLDSPGGIFYTQEREGRGGQRFRIIKFRSMVADAERHGKAVWATRDDPRITRVGKFMRRTRIDELPQFINVLRGEMSIVGPRPERPQFVAQLQEEIPFYRARLSVKPGLTGWAQVKYRYGNTTEDALIKLQYDLYYIKHQSLVLDLLILLRTIRVVLGFEGT